MAQFRSRIKTVTSLAVTAPTANAIVVSWSAPPASGQPVGGFVLYRNGTQLASLGPTVRLYSDEAATSGVSYSYQLVVVSSRGYVSPQQPSSTVVKPFSGSATVSWTPPTTNSAGQTFDNSSNDRTLVSHRIYYGQTQANVAAGTSPYVTVTMPTVTYTFTGLAGGTWYFRVVAVDGDGDESSNTTTYSKTIA